jgi:dihydrofolate reductase
MGRKTFESIGKPLPNRTSLIISSNQNLKIEGCHVFNSLKEALNFAKLNGEQELFIVGGAQIYDLAFSLADKIYLTKINANFNGDAYFPSIDFAKWEKVKETFYEKDEKNPFSHSFVELIKKI